MIKQCIICSTPFERLEDRHEQEEEREDEARRALAEVEDAARAAEQEDEADAERDGVRTDMFQQMAQEAA